MVYTDVVDEASHTVSQIMQGLANISVFQIRALGHSELCLPSSRI